MADTIEVTDFPLGYKWNNVYCILYMLYITLYTPFLLWKDYRNSYYLRDIHESSKTNVFYIFVKDPLYYYPFFFN